MEGAGKPNAVNSLASSQPLVLLPEPSLHAGAGGNVPSVAQQPGNTTQQSSTRLLAHVGGDGLGGVRGGLACIGEAQRAAGRPGLHAALHVCQRDDGVVARAQH